jgi:hypothetical protein
MSGCNSCVETDISELCMLVHMHLYGSSRLDLTNECNVCSFINERNL